MEVNTSHAFQNFLLLKCLFLCGEHLLTAIWFMALQQCGTKILSDSAGWHWKQKHSGNLDNKIVNDWNNEEFDWTRLTFEAALHMSATILPATRVSKMLVVAKLNTFTKATYWNNVTNFHTYTEIHINERWKSGKTQVHEGWVLTLKMSKEHCVRIVLKVEDRPSSTRLSKWVIFSVSVSSRVCSRVLLSMRAKHLCRLKIKKNT